MGDEQQPASDGDLQFERAEYAEQGPAFVCAGCKRSVNGEYYEAGGKFICPACRDAMESAEGGAQRFMVASGLGIGAALIGGVLWFGVRRITGYEIGLIAIAVGFLVGLAVRMGAKGRGGPRYQALAVFLTYTGIALNYAPDIFETLREGAPEEATLASASAPRAAADEASPGASDAQAPARQVESSGTVIGLAVLAALAIALSYAAPFLSGFENIIGLLIIGFALYEAWKLNRRVPIQGPYRTGTASSADAAAG
ncbi:MAG TPA: hypothetical protein VK524_09960 [Polyangiaceae bacterium]|nr:hypothetical protein [Polyangiaceae bacterium]